MNDRKITEKKQDWTKTSLSAGHATQLVTKRTCREMQQNLAGNAILRFCLCFVFRTSRLHAAVHGIASAAKRIWCCSVLSLIPNKSMWTLSFFQVLPVLNIAYDESVAFRCLPAIFSKVDVGSFLHVSPRRDSPEAVECEK